jgi:hypothetical protein
MPPPGTPDRVRRSPLASPFARTLILWVVLVGMFLALWRFFSASSGVTGVPAASPPPAASRPVEP